MVATISPSTLADLRRRGEKVTLIDVRTPAEFGEVHVDFAHNIPLDRLDPKEIQWQERRSLPSTERRNVIIKADLGLFLHPECDQLIQIMNVSSPRSVLKSLSDIARECKALNYFPILVTCFCLGQWMASARCGT